MPNKHNWTSTRQVILVAVFLANFINFTAQWLARKSKDEQVIDRIRSMRFKVFLFGLLSLFACSLVHTGIFVAVMAWILLIVIVVMHYFYFKEFENKIRAIGNLVLHGILLVYIVANVASFVSKADT